MEQTVAAGEGNSILLIGPRGSGKTAVVEKAISELKADYEKEFLVVRLSGFIQTDEKTAVKEIWRQLGTGMEVDENKVPHRNLTSITYSISILTISMANKLCGHSDVHLSTIIASFRTQHSTRT